MNTSSLLTKLKSSFPVCLPLGDDLDLVRCERLYENRPRSIYFFRLISALPDDEELSRLYEKVVSPSYFRAQDASRWSHYLVFVTNDSNGENSTFRERQRTIEEDKRYARKLIVYESEIDGFLDHSVETGAADPDSDVVKIWAQALEAAGLGQIQGRDHRAPVIRAIRSGESASPTGPSNSRTKAPSIGPAPNTLFIRRFHIRSFDKRDIEGPFDFGRINLIRGANGTGKTSLLEAIEHFLCGSTRRSKGTARHLDAEMTFAGGNRVAYRQRDSSDYQDMDRRWYGRTVNRGNELYEGFARFNFLNTDAASDFERDAELRDLKSALSRIALGEAASHTWNRMGEFEEDLTRELRPLKSSLDNLQKNLALGFSRLSALQTSSPKMQAQAALFAENLRQLSFPPSPMPDAGPDAAWIAQFNGLQAFASAFRSLAAPPASLTALNERLAEFERDLAHMNELEALAKTQAGGMTAIRRRREANLGRSTRLDRLQHFLRADFPQLTQSRSQLAAEAVEISRRTLSEAQLQQLSQLSALAPDISLKSFEQGLNQSLHDDRGELQECEKRRSALEEQSRAADVIVAQLQQLGRRYGSTTSGGHECPLCHSPMEMDELVARIERVVDPSPHLAELQRCGTQISRLQVRSEEMTGALAACARLRMAETSEADPLQSHILKARSDKDRQALIAIELQNIDSTLANLQQAGFGRETFESLISDLNRDPDLGNPASLLEASVVDVLLAQAIHAENSSAAEEQKLQTEAAGLSARAAELQGKHGAADMEAARRLIKGEIDSLHAATLAFNTLPESIRSTSAEALASFQGAAIRALAVLEELNAQAQAERARNGEAKLLNEQLARDQAQETQLSAEHGRLAGALEVIQELKAHHSLESGLSSFLTTNLKSIQRIFFRIHTPHELQLSNMADCTLLRMGDKRECKLNQISTGQRSAFMLSVFLSLNLSLLGGPPLMLIDDPVAHIDDLNALAFLDFLADVAESGRRQVFFATANEKLSNLFEKKMEFLGPEEFKILEMPGPRYSSKTV
jgi:exonuclease SbcC